jgi:mevalonate kinase
MTANFPAKLILFGEYTIINNSTALAIPFEKYQGKISFDAKESRSSIESKIVLQKIFQYLLDKFFIHVNFNLGGIECFLFFCITLKIKIPICVTI